MKNEIELSKQNLAELPPELAKYMPLMRSHHKLLQNIFIAINNELKCQFQQIDNYFRFNWAI
jgi:hypothetical protein